MVSKLRYAVPGFTKGKWFCDFHGYREFGSFVGPRCEMVFTAWGSPGGAHLWEGEPDCSKCRVVKEGSR